jgi:hypothetical protein
MKTLDLDSKTLLSALDSLQGRAGFHSTGRTPFFFPGLSVNELGEIAFPLSKEQAAAFTALAEAAPYGKGTKTQHDENVRKCWQLDAKEFAFKSPAWKQFLDATLEKIREDLGITGAIAAQPYKLLLYGPGGHFKAHRDTEKLDAMFGTLIIALPSPHRGGQLYIRHSGVETTVDFSAEAHQYDFQYAALFADCEHEVVPVTSGFRFCVVYNLLLEEGDPKWLNQSPEDHAKPLATLLEKNFASRPSGNPAVILLEHQYTEANFSIKRLKGHDRQRAAALFAAAPHAGVTARMALATFYQMGMLEDGDDYPYGNRYRSYSRSPKSSSDGTMGEVYEESFELDHWRDASDRKLALGRFSVNPDEVITSEDFSMIDPDQKESEGYTGNAGCTMEYWYRRAAIVLWPEGKDEDVLCANNLQAACTQLQSLSSGNKTGSGTPFDRLAHAAIRALAPAIRSGQWSPHGIDKDFHLPISKILQALAHAKRRDLLEELLLAVPAGDFGATPQALWGALFTAFGVDAFVSVFDKMLDFPDTPRDSLFCLLDALNAQCGLASWQKRFAISLAKLKPTEPPRWQADQSEDPIPSGDLNENRILLAASRGLSDKSDIAAALRFLKSDQSLAAVRGRIGPLFIGKGAATKGLRAESTVAKELLDFCAVLLAKEIARPLLPYTDWRRPCPPLQENKSGSPYVRNQSNPALQDLLIFMADPNAREYAIRRRQDERMRVEEFIKQHFLDLDCQTIRQGTPHTLLCTKNDRSYQRALQWREKDEEMLRKLEAL